MIVKFATFEVISARLEPLPSRDLNGAINYTATPGLMKDAHRVAFHYTPRPGYLYVRSRAISSRANDNHDEFPAEEIKKAWATFIGKPVFVNHNNEDHRRARGVIVDAALHEDTNPNGTPDTWTEVLMEVDAIRFPMLAKAILAGHIDRTSMGTDVKYSLCSVCSNKASNPTEYCAHIPRLKGQRIYRTTASGKKEAVLVTERCYGLGFFENSLLVEEPADPTAFFTGVDDSGVRDLGMTYAKTASKTAAFGVDQDEYLDEYDHGHRRRDDDDDDHPLDLLNPKNKADNESNKEDLLRHRRHPPIEVVQPSARPRKEIEIVYPRHASKEAGAKTASSWQKTPEGRSYRTSLIGKNGRTYYITMAYFDNISAFTEGPYEPVGALNVWDSPFSKRKEIFKTNVNEAHRRQGIASAMLALAREGFPDVVHSDALSEDGKSWSKAYAKTAGATAPPSKDDWRKLNEYFWCDKCKYAGNLPHDGSGVDTCPKCKDQTPSEDEDGNIVTQKAAAKEPFLKGHEVSWNATSAPYYAYCPCGFRGADTTFVGAAYVDALSHVMLHPDFSHDDLNERERELMSRALEKAKPKKKKQAIIAGAFGMRTTAASIPSFPDSAILQQFKQYPQGGPAGLSYFKGEINSELYVDCLLFRKGGELVGVLNHYPKDMGPERKGNVLLLVHPKHRGRGIGKTLWKEAQKRWGVKAKGQDTTPEGAAFLRNVGKKQSVLAGRVRGSATEIGKVYTTRLGRCFELTAKRVMDRNLGKTSSDILVHGSIQGDDVLRISHCWVIEGAGIWEPATNMHYQAEAFSRLFSAVEEHRYTWPEARDYLIKNKHYGPWRPMKQAVLTGVPRGDEKVLDLPVSKFGLVYRPENLMAPEVIEGLKFQGWDDLPLSQVNLRGLNATEEMVASRTVNRLVERGQSKADYYCQVVRAAKGFYLLDGHHRAAVYGEMGHTSMPAKILDLSEMKTSRLVGKIRKSAYGETKAPAEVDTLRDELCPVCGESDTYNGDECTVCGYSKPIGQFADPDLDVARETDLRQDVADGEDAKDDLGLDGQTSDAALPVLECTQCGWVTEGSLDEDTESPADDTNPHQVKVQTHSRLGGRVRKSANAIDGSDFDGSTPLETDTGKNNYREGDPCPKCGGGTLQIKGERSSGAQPANTTPSPTKAEGDSRLNGK